MPADAGVDDRGHRRFNALRQYRDLVPGTAAFNQIEHRQPVNDDEFATHCLARAAHDVDGETNPILERAAPFVVTKISLWRDELIDQVALGPHDLDTVIARALR